MKNLFIMTAAKTGTQAGLPGGLDPDTVYRLTDLYIQECERLHSVRDIEVLLHSMLLDFCRRIGESRLPSDISEDVLRSLNYIHAHINESILVSDLSEYTGRSASYLNRLFQRELGMSINACITDRRLKKAADLLTHSDMTLVEISCFLGFSSQSYFQNCFRKAYGITPMHYRKENGKQ